MLAMDLGKYLPQVRQRVKVLRVTPNRLVLVEGLDGRTWAFERSSGKASGLGGHSGSARQVSWSDWRVLFGQRGSDDVWTDPEGEHHLDDA